MIKDMGHYTAIGMRQKITHHDALIINTCSNNDSSTRGTPQSWSWSNPTNTIIKHPYEDVIALSVECLWQGCKLLPGETRPNPNVLAGAWRTNKGKKPTGAYTGPNKEPLTDPGTARRAIYLPAYKRLIEHWLEHDEQVRAWVENTRAHPGLVFLRDFDTGRGVDNQGPLSHAWILAYYLNSGQWPE